MPPTAILEPIDASEEQAKAVAEFGQALGVLSQAVLVGPQGQKYLLPEPIFRVLEQVVPLLAAGNAISIVPVGHQLTTQEAADLLNVSRPHLIKLLKANEIPFEYVGTHRKIRFDDLMAYKHKRDKVRRESVRKLTELAQDYGLYEE